MSALHSLNFHVEYCISFSGHENKFSEFICRVNYNEHTGLPWRHKSIKWILPKQWRATHSLTGKRNWPAGQTLTSTAGLSSWLFKAAARRYFSKDKKVLCETWKGFSMESSCETSMGSNGPLIILIFLELVKTLLTAKRIKIMLQLNINTIHTKHKNSKDWHHMKMLK